MSTDVLTRRPYVDESLSLRRKDLGIPVAQVFPQAHASIYFGRTEDIPLERAARDPFFYEFMFMKNLMLKLAILFASQNGIPVGLRGSTLDQYLIAHNGGEQNNLFLLKKNVNRTRGIGQVDCASTYHMDQGIDDIHDPGNPDIRFSKEDESEMFIRQFGIFLRKHISDIDSKQLVFPSERVKKRNGNGSYYLEAWRLKKPRIKRSLTFGTKADGSAMPILRFYINEESIGAPDIMNKPLREADFILSTHELGSISFTGNSKGDRRRAGRCFNIDTLFAQMKLPPFNENLFDESLLDPISQMQVYLELPEIPRDLSISSEAIAFYEEGIKRDDPDFIDAWFEIVIRGIRKAVNLEVNQYDDQSIQETKRLCSIAAEKWNSVKHDSHTLIKNFRELEVAMTANRGKTTSLMEITGIRSLFQLAFEQYSKSESKSVSVDYMKSLIE